MQHTLQSITIRVIKKILLDNKLSQSDLANKLDLSRQMIANYLSGRTEITLNKFDDLCGALGITPNYVVNEYERELTGDTEENEIHNFQVGDFNKAVNFNRVKEGNVSYSSKNEILEIKLKAAKREIEILNEQIELYKKLSEK